VLARHLGSMWGAHTELVVAGSGAAMQQRQQQPPRLPVQIRQQHGGSLQMSYQNGAQSSLAPNIFGEFDTFLGTALSENETSLKLEQDCSRLKQVVADQNDHVQVSSPHVFRKLSLSSNTPLAGPACLKGFRAQALRADRAKIAEQLRLHDNEVQTLENAGDSAAIAYDELEKSQSSLEVPPSMQTWSSPRTACCEPALVPVTGR